MSRIVRCSLIQATNVSPAQAMVDKHLGYIRQAAGDGSQIICLQEIFNGPYFCAEQETRWYDLAQAIPDGLKSLQDEACRRHWRDNQGPCTDRGPGTFVAVIYDTRPSRCLLRRRPAGYRLRW